MCIWKRAYQYSDSYKTECGKDAVLEKDESTVTPKDVGYKYCPFCGKEIQEIEIPESNVSEIK